MLVLNMLKVLNLWWPNQTIVTHDDVGKTHPDLIWGIPSTLVTHCYNFRHLLLWLRWSPLARLRWAGTGAAHYKAGGSGAHVHSV